MQKFGATDMGQNSLKQPANPSGGISGFARSSAFSGIGQSNNEPRSGSLVLPPNNPNGQLNHLNLQNKAKNKNLATESDEPRPKISQDHYRHIHEQRDFTLENLSLAGFTDVIDYSELKIMPEFEFEIDAEITQINKEINEES